MGIKDIINFTKGASRGQRATKQIILSLFARGVSILTSLLIVPLTISYVNPSQYGIWMTISSVVSWIYLLDLGIGNGFRNKYAIAKASGDMKLCREYLSTAYFSISIIVIFILSIVLIGNSYIDWAKVLKLDEILSDELRKVFGIVFCFTGLTMIANIFSTLLTADQKPGVSSIILAIGQVISLGVIIVISKVSEGSLVNLALFYSGIPFFSMLVASIIGFSYSKYKELSPKLSYVRVGIIKDIVSLGIEFFIICVSVVFVFQLSNIVLTRELGPDAVTEYNIAYKYFHILYTVMIIFLTPFWTAFTDAHAKGDTGWMKSTVKKLEKVFSLSVVIAIIMLLLSNCFFHIWVGKNVQVNYFTSISVAVYIILLILANVYMYLINGIGTLRIQLIVYLVAAILSWPLLTYCCRAFGLWGIVIVPSVTCFVQAVLGKIQLTKLLNGTAKGIWNK